MCRRSCIARSSRSKSSIAGVIRARWSRGQARLELELVDAGREHPQGGRHLAPVAMGQARPDRGERRQHRLRLGGDLDHREGRRLEQALHGAARRGAPAQDEAGDGRQAVRQREARLATRRSVRSPGTTTSVPSARSST